MTVGNFLFKEERNLQTFISKPKIGFSKLIVSPVLENHFSRGHHVHYIVTVTHNNSPPTELEGKPDQSKGRKISKLLVF